MLETALIGWQYTKDRMWNYQILDNEKKISTNVLIPTTIIRSDAPTEEVHTYLDKILFSK